MARRPFDIAAHGWEKVEYRRGDVLDRDSVDSLVEEADVVVHLAFVIVAGKDESREINLRGSRNVFEAAAAAGAKRLVYTSSVAAYGFDRGLPEPDRRGRAGCAAAPAIPTPPTRPRSRRSWPRRWPGSSTDAYVFRPCIVAGPDATLLLDLIPLVALGQAVPGPGALGAGQGAVAAAGPARPRRPLPARPPGRRRRGALSAAVIGGGEPGTYNLAGPGELTVTDLAHELGWHAVPAPRLAVSATAEVARPGPLPARRGGLDRGDPPAGPDGHRAGAPQAALDAPPRRPPDPAPDGRRGPRQEVGKGT